MRTIQTERLILDKWTTSKEDIKGLYAYARNPDVGPRAGWKPHESLDESEEIIQTLFIPHDVWAIREKETGKVIGSIGLEPDRRREDVNSREMGYSLAKESWGKGYMTEAAKAVIDYAFRDLDLVVLSICTSPTNKRSQRVIEKCGFKFENTTAETFRAAVPIHESSNNHRDYRLLRRHFESKGIATASKAD